MRKSIITLSTLLALVISGCTSTPKKKKSATSEQPTTEAPSKTSEVSPTSATQSPTTPPTSAQPTSATPTSVAPTSSRSETTLVPPPTPGTEVTKTIVTCLDDFKTNAGFTGSSQQIDTDLTDPTNDKTKNAAKLKTYFESICDAEGMVEDLVFHNLNTIIPQGNSDVYLTLGTSNQGTINWTSSVAIKSVSLVVNNYHKYYRDYTVEGSVEQWHTDNAQLSINNQKYEMNVTDTSIQPTHQTFTYAPSESFTSFEVTNDLIGGTDHNRIFIESISITFVF